MLRDSADEALAARVLRLRDGSVPSNPTLSRMVVRKETGSAMKARAVMDGMDTLRDDGWRRVLQGQTTVEDVVRVTQQDEAMSETD